MVEICCLIPLKVSGFTSVGKSRQCVHDQMLSNLAQYLLSASLISSVISSSLILARVLSMSRIGCLLVRWIIYMRGISDIGRNDLVYRDLLTAPRQSKIGNTESSSSSSFSTIMRHAQHLNLIFN